MTHHTNDDPLRSGIYPTIPSGLTRRTEEPSGSWRRDREALAKWAFGIITTAGLALCGWLWSGFNHHETRLVAVETQQKIDATARTEEQRRLDSRLDRMDRKLDEVLMWQRRDLHPPGQTP